MFNNVNNKAQSVSSKCGNFAANQRTFTQKALVSSKACNEWLLSGFVSPAVDQNIMNVRHFLIADK